MLTLFSLAKVEGSKAIRRGCEKLYSSGLVDVIGVVGVPINLAFRALQPFSETTAIKPSRIF